MVRCRASGRTEDAESGMIEAEMNANAGVGRMLGAVAGAMLMMSLLAGGWGCSRKSDAADGNSTTDAQDSPDDPVPIPDATYPRPPKGKLRVLALGDHFVSCRTSDEPARWPQVLCE